MLQLLGSWPKDLSPARLLGLPGEHRCGACMVLSYSPSDWQEAALMVHLGTPGAQLGSASADKVSITPINSDRVTIQV